MTRRSDREGKLGHISGEEQPGHRVIEHKGLKIGDRVPMPPKPTIKVRPMSWVDGPKNSPKGVFRNGTR